MRLAPLFAFVVLASAPFDFPVSAGEADEPPAAATGEAAAAAAEPDAGGATPKARTIEPVVAPVAAAPAAAHPGKGASKKPPPVAAKELFGAVKTAAPLQARAIGTYAKGCLAGAEAMPVDGPNWQAMRLSRNRNWGHPKLITLLKRLSEEAWRHDGWPGLLVGDIAQPRGGPMLTGHASHQVGLDADIWLTPMPDRRLTAKEREEINATSMLAADEISVNPEVWTAAHVKLIKRAAKYEEVERVLVHPAIKKALCLAADADDRLWLHKVRPYWGHYYHFHVRIGCPAGATGCTPQKPVPNEDGCGKEVADWIKLVTPKPKPATPPPPPVAQPAKPATPKPQVTLASLPAECRVVLNSGNPGVPRKLMEAQRVADEAEAAAKKAAEAAAAKKAAAAAAAKAARAAKVAAKPDKPATPTPPATTPAAPAAAPPATAAVAPAAQPAKSEQH